ncbi:Flp family type IVb pilin [Sinorhizobium fredii]|uniref:Flp family type IVb pilin n=1 Tax=Rhizobium fredii TaxID=380 RepID=UPI00059570C0|nr:hypothetical protein [Sinorhizobium fredii]WOS66812.1 hypothetical protein SFGR64A_26870 [Sinorhizobium fredii GR64]
MEAFVAKVSAFAREEDGVALTEYLILLALLVGGVITAVTTAGGNLSAAWETWGSWWTGEVSAPAVTP